jgi:hypothetical protein
VPNYQGGLDWLCGPYSVLNALERFGLEEYEEMFQVALSALAKSRWPKLLWEGTGIGDLNKMSRAILDHFEYGVKIALSQPFRKTVPKTDAEFWDKFDVLFSSSEDCAIVYFEQFEDLDSHWLVVHPNVKGGLNFIDSYNVRRPKLSVTKAEVFAGCRKPASAKYRIKRKDVLLFKKIA